MPRRAHALLPPDEVVPDGTFAVAPMSFERANALFEYDSTEGGLYWRGGSRHLAGCFIKQRHRRVVTVDYRPIPVIYIIWLLNKGHWPKGVLGHRDLNPHNTRIDNIAPIDEIRAEERPIFASLFPRAERARALRVAATTVKVQRSNAENLLIVPSPGIVYVAPPASTPAEKGRWEVYASLWNEVDNPASTAEITRRKSTRMAVFTDYEDAERYHSERLEGFRCVHDFPDPGADPEVRKWLEGFKAMQPHGTRGATLAHIHAIVAYDPDTGYFYHRGRQYDRPATIRPDNRIGARAEIKTGRYLSLHVAPCRYPAHMVAWFIMTQRWPPRKGLIHLDGDTTNNSIDNLQLRTPQ